MINGDPEAATIVSPVVLRVWDEARASHFELLAGMHPATLLYRRRNYSFDSRLAQVPWARRAGTLGALRFILLGRYDVLELNEPTMVRLWPRLVLYSTAFRMRSRIGRTRPICVLYAIDNFELGEFFERGPLKRIPRRWWSAVFAYLYLTFDRVCFGSAGAYNVYRRHLGAKLGRPETRLIAQVPGPCTCVVGDEKAPKSVLFLGSLEDRKGIRELMRAWDEIGDSALSLTIIGKGPLLEVVRNWAEGHSSVSFVVDPPRMDVHAALRRSVLVVLLSQRSSTWREQVGLPIVEGLAHGCEVLATSETGIAQYLAESGHGVVDPADPPSGLAREIERRAGSPRSFAYLMDALPEEHTRYTADRWLVRPST